MAEKKQAIAIYSRKSRFTGKGESIENQIELCRQYITGHKGKDAPTPEVLIYEDEGFSGGNLERPQFKRMMADAKTGEFSTIVVYRLDRISRNIGDFAKLIEELSDLTVAFVSIKEQFDTSSPMGRAMMYIASVFSQLERETIAERIRDNMHELAKTGRWLGGVTPTGYASEQVNRVTVDGKVRKACKLKLVPEEAEIVKLVFSKFLETHSLSGTDAFLLENGYRTKNGKPFTRVAIKNILMNPVYTAADESAYVYLKETGVELFSEKAEFDKEHGLMAYNRTLQKTGRANQIRPMTEWIMSVGKHSPLVTGAQWVKVQRMLNQNKSKTYRKPRGNVALLSGVLVCGSCGAFMRPKMTNRFTASGEPLYTYMCTLKERSRSQCCHVKNANGNLLDRGIVDEIKQLPEDDDEFTRNLEEGRRGLSNNREEYDDRLAQLRSECQNTQAQIKALVTSLTRVSGTAAEDYIMQQIDELHGKNERVKCRLDQLNQIAGRRILSAKENDVFRERLCSFEDTIDSMMVGEVRAAIRACVQKVVWDGENVHLYLFGAEENDHDRLRDTACGFEGHSENVPLGGNSK